MEHRANAQEHLFLARRLREKKDKVAAAVTEEFLRIHPDWVTRYGERALARGTEDAAYHVEFLASAVDAGSVAAFEDYVRWTTRVLGTRGIDARFVAENLAQIREALRGILSDREEVLAGPFLDAGIAASRAPATGATGLPSVPGDAQRIFVAALLNGDRKAAATIAREALLSGASALDVYADLLQPALYEVGRRWETNQISVADEHMATAIVQYVIGQLYERLDVGAPTRGTMVIAGVPGELHQVGANMAADLLESCGWDVRFLGANVPENSMLSAIERHAAGVVGLSMTMLPHLPGLRQLVRAIRNAFPTVPRIVVGGRAFHASATLWQEVGADQYAPNLREAVRLLC
jgi:MerR family transcriptional regulator, light-induced transcriptional regulator